MQLLALANTAYIAILLEMLLILEAVHAYPAITALECDYYAYHYYQYSYDHELLP